MADTLEDRLEPGERVVWPDPCRRPPAALWRVWASLFGRPVDVAVTERRILLSHRTADGGADVFILPLGEVVGVALTHEGLGLHGTITRRDGTVIRIGRRRHLQGLLAAIAAAAGLPRPALVGRLEHLAACCFVIGGVGLGGSVLAPLASFTLISGAGTSFGASPGYLPALYGAIVLGIWLCTHLAVLAAVLVMPAVASAQEAENWLRLEPGGKWGQRMLWRHPLYIRLLQWRYGAPPDGPREGAASHG